MGKNERFLKVIVGNPKEKTRFYERTERNEMDARKIFERGLDLNGLVQRLTGELVNMANKPLE